MGISGKVHVSVPPLLETVQDDLITVSSDICLSHSLKKLVAMLASERPTIHNRDSASLESIDPIQNIFNRQRIGVRKS
jgi:hypothetical protein